jgi:hypothetical protein
MGDFNDDPTSPSIKDGLKTSQSMDETTLTQLYNPWTRFFEQGIGTLANRDSWGLFDQILLSRAWLDKTATGFFFQEAQIFNEGFLRENTGRYKNYPMRTWDGNHYRGGYSDHFPTYVVLLKNIK